MKHFTVSSVVVLFSLAGCSNEPQNAGPSQGPQVAVGCISDLECDDGEPCTVDSCDVGPIGAECVHEDATCDNPNFVCDVRTGACVCDESSDCDDGTFCNGVESCSDAVCLSGESPCIGVQECDEAEGYCFTPLEAIQTATWLVLAGSDWSGFTATAFGVTDEMFATSAHVTEGLKSLFGEPTAQAFLFQHETGAWRAITDVWAHPGYDASNVAGTPDVGLLRAAPLDSSSGSFEPLFLAEDVGLSDLQVFDEVSICGFPADVTEVFDLPGLLAGTIRPRTTCLQGTISALRPFDPFEPATPDNTFLIQYDLPIVGGTSGSAVFDSRGSIIGVNSFGFTTGGDFHFAIRSDILRELLSWTESGIAESTVLDEIRLDVPPCHTSYFNSEWQFGFDLPAGFNQLPNDESVFEVTFNRTSESQGVISFIGIEVTDGSLEATYLSFLQYLEEEASIEMITTDPIVMSNGVPGFITVVLSQNEDSSNPQDDFYFYVVQTVGVFGVYHFWGSTRVSDVPSLGPILADAALSLCTEWPRTASRSPSSVPRYGQSEWDVSLYQDMVSEAAENIQRNLQPADQNIEKD